MSMCRIWRRAPALLLLSLVLPTFAQIRTHGDMIHMLDVKPGKIVKGKVTVVNRGKIVAGFRIFALESKGKRDASSWIKFDEEYLNIQAGQAMRVSYKLRVPKKVTGSYFVRYAVQPIKREKAGMVGIRIRYEGTIVITVPGGESGIEFSSCDYRNGNLFTELENVGTIAYRPTVIFFAGGKEYKVERRLLLPGKKILFATSAVSVPAGRVIVFADCAPGVAYGTQWTVEGIEAIREFVTIVPVRMRLRSDFGPGGNRLLASASTSVGRWRLGMGSFFDKHVNRVNFNLGYTTRQFSLHSYVYKRSESENWRLNFGGFLNLRRWNVMLNAQPFAETGQAMIRYRFNHGYLGLRASVVQHNLDWNLSVSIPLTLNLKFRKRMKPEHQELKTFIVK